jgi:hypothetical protein
MLLIQLTLSTRRHNQELNNSHQGKYLLLRLNFRTLSDIRVERNFRSCWTGKGLTQSTSVVDMSQTVSCRCDGSMVAAYCRMVEFC